MSGVWGIESNLSGEFHPTIVYLAMKHQFSQRFEMRILISLLFVIGLTACKADETISGYVDMDTTWALVELNGAPFTARATMAFPEKGLVTGKAPCNSYSASQSVPLPWFELGPIMSTKMACPDMQDEQQFFDALAQMSLAETLNDTLILRNDEGHEMVFKSAP